jgi:hypothetical protein
MVGRGNSRLPAQRCEDDHDQCDAMLPNLPKVFLLLQRWVVTRGGESIARAGHVKPRQRALEASLAREISLSMVTV